MVGAHGFAKHPCPLPLALLPLSLRVSAPHPGSTALRGASTMSSKKAMLGCDPFGMRRVFSVPVTCALPCTTSSTLSAARNKATRLGEREVEREKWVCAYEGVSCPSQSHHHNHHHHSFRVRLCPCEPPGLRQRLPAPRTSAASARL